MNTFSVNRARASAGLEPHGSGPVNIAGRGEDSYPPCDVEWIDSHLARITLAVAGFAIDDLAVTAVGRKLVVRGRRPKQTTPTVWLHRGIAMRQFQRTFALADGVEVTGAALDDGLLRIDLDLSRAETAGSGAPRRHADAGSVEGSVEGSGAAACRRAAES